MSNQSLTTNPNNNNDEPTLTDIMKEIQSSAITVNEIKSSLNKIGSRLDRLEELKVTVDEVEKSQKFLSEKFDELQTKVNSIDKNNKELKAENTFLNNKVKELSVDLENERFKQNQQEQYGRQRCWKQVASPKSQMKNV